MTKLELRTSQKAELAKKITESGLDHKSFDLEVYEDSDGKDSGVLLRHRDSNAYFKIELQYWNDNPLFVMRFSPGHVSQSEEAAEASTWSSVLLGLGSWLGIVKAELEAMDPWGDEKPEIFDDTERGFTQLELKTLDSAIDASFEKLVELGKEQNPTLTMESMASDIKYLKDEARKRKKSEWLMLFKEVVASKVVDLGLTLLLADAVLHTLYETAKPILKIVAGN